MILKLIFALGPIGVVLILSEILWRKKLIKGERARKFIHVLAGSWMAFWPFYLPFDGIFILGCAALTLLIYSRITTLFHAIYAVKRKGYGDIIYAVSIIICALLAKEDWVFTIAILLLALADGAAAVVGRLWAKKNYHVFNYKSLKKSYLGTFAFVVFSYLAVAVGYFVGGSDVINDNPVLFFVYVPFIATLLENITPAGVDNLTIPVVVTLIISTSI
jgi:phytol kinase